MRGFSGDAAGGTGLLKAYRIAKGNLQELDGELTQDELQKSDWVDLSGGSAEEKRLVENALGIDTSPANEFEPFQVSSHFSSSAQQMTMTGLLLTVSEETHPQLLKVTFIRTRSVLVTVSDEGPIGMSTLIKECENCFTHRSDGDDIFAAILDMVVDHTDNILDKVGHDLDRLNASVFQHHATPQRRLKLQSSPRLRNRQLEAILTALGPSREILVKLRRSVLSFRRMVAFMRDQKLPKSLLARLVTFERDLQSIAEAELDLSTTAGFLLDGVVAYIELLQNKVVNILTLVNVILTPPMVIGAIYGMNFKTMPELNWAYGYPMSLGLIVLSTAGLYYWVRARGL